MYGSPEALTYRERVLHRCGSFWEQGKVFDLVGREKKKLPFPGFTGSHGALGNDRSR